MAVLFDQNQEQNKNNQDLGAPQQQTNPGVVSSGGQAAGPTSASPSGGTSSGRFSNITNYIKANQNFNKEGGGLAGKIVDNVNKQGQQITQNVANAVQQFNNQADSQVQQTQAAVPLVQQAVANPNQFLQNQQNVNTITQARDATYTGPKSLSDLSGKQNQSYLQGQAKDFKTTTDQAQTSSGRYNLLRSMFGNNSYTSGQQNLDNLLIQGNKDQTKKLQESRKASAAVNTNLNQNISDAQTKGTQSAQIVADTRNQIRQALNSRVGQEEAAIQDALSKAKEKQAQDLANTQNDLSNDSLSEELLNQYGLSGTNLYNASLADLVRTQGAPNAENVASSENYSQIAALRNLLGNAADENSSKVLAQYTDPTKAGSFYTNPNIVFDVDALKQRIAASKAQYEQEANPLNAQIEQANSALTGDLYFKGGIEQAVKDRANLLRSNLNKQIAPGIIENNVGDISGLDDLTLLNRFAQYDPTQVAKNLPYNNGIMLTDPTRQINADDPNSIARLLSQYQFEQNKRNATKAALEALNQKYNVNRVLKTAGKS